MKSRIPIAMLLATTAMATTAIAQEQEGEATQGDLIAECQEMLTYVQENDVEGTGMNEDRAQRIARANNAQYCSDGLQLAQGEISDVEGQENYDADAAARLLVAVPDPEVTVTQDAPDVTVEQQAPEVRVNPGQPTVTVQQAEPVVRVEVQPPRITIDMPKPRILVEMPDPSVEVAMRQPRVSVEQGQPQVSVEQGEPQIQVDEQAVAAGETDGEAEVLVEQEQATVQLEQAESADVQIQEARPNVRYSAAEPRIEVEQTGDPEIAFNQSGEADVQFRQMTAEETRAMGDDEAQAQAAGEQAQEPQETADATQAQEGEAIGVIESSGVEAEGEGAAQRISVENLLDMQVVGANGEEIGDVEDIVVRGDEPYVIIGHGGFLGLGERQIALPVSDMRLRDDVLVMRDITEEEVGQMQDASADDFGAVESGAEVDVRAE